MSRVAELFAEHCPASKAGYHFTGIYPFDQVVLDSRDKYYRALNSAQQRWHEPEEDLTPWVDYFVGAVFEQWERAYRTIRDARRQSGYP